MSRNAAWCAIGATLVVSLSCVDVGQAFPIEQRPAARILLAGDMTGTANPATVLGSNTPTVAPVQKSTQASVKGLRESPLVWAGAPRSSRALAQTSPIAASGLTPPAAQTAHPRRAWLIGLIWSGSSGCSSGSTTYTRHPTYTTERLTDADGRFSILPRGTDVPESATNAMASHRGEGGSMPQAMVCSPTPLKRCCKNYQIGLARGNPLLAQSWLRVRCDWVFSLDFRRSRP